MADAPFIIRPLPASSRTLEALDSPENNLGRENGTDASLSTAQRPRRSRSRHHRGGSSLGTVFGDSKVQGSLHWNQDVATSGLVCGSSVCPISSSQLSLTGSTPAEQRATPYCHADGKNASS